MNKTEWFAGAPQLVIRTPATSANLGPGFDCLGMAVDLYNELWIKPQEQGQESVISVEGYGGDRAASPNNLIYTTYCRAYKEMTGNAAPPVALHCINRIPFARGLGSSSAAIVSGLAVAQILSGKAFDRDSLLRFAAQADGHPDNVLPALLGGVVVGFMEPDGHVVAEKLDPPQGLYAYALIPDYELKTADARAALPATYSRADAVFNMGHLGVLVAALASGNMDFIARGLADRIHEPYRLPLMPGIPQAKEAALEAGALAAVVSGAGSTMLILSDHPQDFGQAKEVLNRQGIDARLIEVAPIDQGVQIYRDEMELNLWR
jgi:homoserine kinase